MPFWLIQIILIAVAIFKFYKALKYMKSETLFVKEVRVKRIDMSRINSARKLYFMHDVSFLVFLIIFPILVYISVVKPFLVYILVLFIATWLGLYLWWSSHFSAKN